MLQISSNIDRNVPVDDISRKKIDFIYRILKHQSSKKTAQESQHQPFRIINSIAHNCLDEFIRYILDIQFRDEYPDTQGRSLVTSCVNSFCTFSTLFLGVRKAKEMIYLINTSSNQTFNIKLPSGKFFTFKTLDLFAGNATNAISQDPKFQALKIKEQAKQFFVHLYPHMSHFHNRILQHVIDHYSPEKASDEDVAAAIIPYVKSSRYPFNLSVINSLRDHITANSAKVNGKISFLYCVKTKIPFYEEDEIASRVEHAFLLEQFYCPARRSSLVRLYQSWIDTATVLDEIAKHGFDEMGKGAWDGKQVDAFLDRLEDYYCSNTGYLEPEKAIACFGYQCYRESREPLVTSVRNLLTGISVRYIVHEFDPNNCLGNLQDILHHSG